MSYECVITTLYSGDDSEKIVILVDTDDNSIWMSQKTVAKLFDVDRETLENHVKKIMDENKDSSDFYKTPFDNLNYAPKIYDFDMVLDLAFTINTRNAILFRRWIIGNLRDYIIKGYILNEDQMMEA